MSDKKYYFITVFCDYDAYGPHDMRCWGFFDTFKDANETLSYNKTDLWETVYNYGVIEEYNMGIAGHTLNRWFYEYDKETNRYNWLSKDPKELTHYVGFALG